MKTIFLTMMTIFAVAAANADTATEVNVTGVLKVAYAQDSETTGYGIYRTNPNRPTLIIEVDLRDSNGNPAQTAAWKNLITMYGQPDIVVKATGEYETLDLGPMRPNAKILRVHELTQIVKKIVKK